MEALRGAASDRPAIAERVPATRIVARRLRCIMRSS
jgi:hypothetical protein